MDLDVSLAYYSPPIAVRGGRYLSRHEGEICLESLEDGKRNSSSVRRSQGGLAPTPCPHSKTTPNALLEDSRIPRYSLSSQPAIWVTNLPGHHQWSQIDRNRSAKLLGLIPAAQAYHAMNSRRGKKQVETRPALRSEAGSQRPPLKVAGAGHSGDVNGGLNAATTTAGKNISHHSTITKETQKGAPITTTTNINFTLPGLPQASNAQNGESSQNAQSSIPKNESIELPPERNGMSRVSSGESTRTQRSLSEELGLLQLQAENARIKVELTQLKTNLVDEEAENERLSNEIAHVKKLYSATEDNYQVLLAKFQKQETELKTAQNRIKIYACQQQTVSQLQSTGFDLQKSFLEEIATDKETIKHLEANYHDLKRKYLDLAERFQEESSQAQDRRLNSEVKKRLDEAEAKVKILRLEAKNAREAYTAGLLIEAQGWEEQSGENASNSESKDNNDGFVETLEKEMKRTKDELRKAEKDLAARRNEMNPLSNTVSMQEEALPHRRKYKGTQHDTCSSTPGLTNSEGRSTSSLSASPPYPETMDQTILERHFQNPPFTLFAKAPPDVTPTRNDFDTRSHASRKGKKPLR